MASLVEIAELLHEKLIKLINLKITPVIQQLDHLRNLIESRKCSLTSNEENIIKEIFSRYNTTSTEWLLKIDRFQTDLKIIIGILNPRVTWIPETQEDAIFSYYNGNSPWSLTLVAENWKIDTMAIRKEIIDIFVDGGIDEFPGNATIGDYVFYFKGDRINRGLIKIVSDERYGIINIDNGHLVFCDKNMILWPACDTELNPAQSLHCSIVNSAEYDESLWCPELDNIFKSFLVENKFKLATWSKDSSVPPKFTVRLIAINDLKQEVDFTKWLEEEILKPWKLEGLPSGNSAIQFFGHRLKDPFESYPTKLSHEKSLNQTVNSTSASNFESQQTLKCENRFDHSGIIARLQKALEERKSQVVIFPTANSSTKTEQESAVKTEANTEEAFGYQSQNDRFWRQYLTSDVVLKQNCDKLQQRPADAVKTEANTEEAFGYQPDRNDRFWRQYLTSDVDLKQNCDKLQQRPADEAKLTDDKTKVYLDSFNSVNLPVCGEVAVIKVLEIVDGCSFFGSFSTSFSIQGKTVKLIQVMRSINDPVEITSYKCLPTIPTVGEIVLALCEDKMFYRARVIGISAKGYSVFQVDYGRKEDVSFENLKMIDEKFLHYPFQAKKFRLNGISCKNEKKALAYISEIKGKIFRAVLIPSSQEEYLKVTVFIGDSEKTLNKLMVENGGCDIIQD